MTPHFQVHLDLDVHSYARLGPQVGCPSGMETHIADRLPAEICQRVTGPMQCSECTERRFGSLATCLAAESHRKSPQTLISCTRLVADRACVAVGRRSWGSTIA